MTAILWKTPIPATWKRALDLKDICASSGSLRLEIEDESGKMWIVEFKSVQAWMVTAEECSGNIFSELPDEGALFVVQQSDWVQRLGDSPLLQKSQHFVIFLYDEVVEVLAWDYSVHETKALSTNESR